MYWKSLIFAVTALCVMAWPCAAQTITVRLQNAENGQPVVGQEVDVRFSVPKLKGSDGPGEGNQKFTTDAAGEVHVAVPNPAPKVVLVTVPNPGNSRWLGFYDLLLKLDRVLNRGFVGDLALDLGPSQEMPSGPNAVPGTIAIPMRPTPFWQRILYPFLKD